MRKERLLLVLAALALIGLSAWLFLRPSGAESPSRPLPPLAPSGAVTSPPFGKGESAQATPAAPPSLDDLKRKYFTLHDRAARFALLKDRPEPEAQYLAYRAFHECGRVMSNLQDGNDLAYTLKQLWAEQGVTDRSAREAALQQWESACRGFLRPNPDVKRDADALLRSAVAAGHAGARALAFDLATDVDAATARALSAAIVESGDPLVLFDGHAAIVRARLQCGTERSRVEAEHIAWILAACRVADCYRTDLFFAYGLCALEGACDQKTIEATYIDPKRSAADRQRLLARAAEVEQQMRERRTQQLLACQPS